jgi:CheY-like chemotaxis protein
MLFAERCNRHRGTLKHPSPARSGARISVQVRRRASTEATSRSALLPYAAAITVQRYFESGPSGARRMKRSTTILLIEDDPSVGPATLEVLAAEGHAAVLATSFDEAFEILLAPHRIQVLLLDLQLGLRRGDELIESLRARGATIPPIVIFSARPLDELVHAARMMGAEAFLQKPCSGIRLAEAIELATAQRPT